MQALRAVLLLPAWPIAAALTFAPAPAAVQAPDVTVSARTLRPGDVLVVTVAAPASPSIRTFDRDWPVYALSPGRWQALIGVDLAVRPARYAVTVATSAGRSARDITVAPRTFPTRRLTVDPNLVNPPPEALERIDREARELAGIWRATAAERLWRGPFVAPVPDAPNSAFGTRSILNGEARAPHGGADFLSPTGRPIKAPNTGRIALAGPLYYTGNTVVIDHGMGLFSLFAHLSEIDVHAGTDVSRGDVVGKVGATGRVTGPHLHWSVRLDGARVDPLALMSALRAEEKE